MNFTTALGFTAGFLQFVVAGYALLLNRRYGTRRVGWSLFWAFLLLALLNLTQLAMAHATRELFVLQTDVMNTLVSLLLLVGMIHLEATLKERRRAEFEEQRIRGELEAEVKKKTSYLLRAVEGLQTEMDKRKKAELQAQTARMELEIVSRHNEMTQVATAVLLTVEEISKNIRVAEYLASEQSDILKELESIKAHIDQIKAIGQNTVSRVSDTEFVRNAAAAAG
jgi:C4-dicarboxylate-specific signal transduction histidine kinase